MTAPGWVALRLAATLAHVLPGVRLRLRHGSGAPLVVARSPGGEGPVVDACAFREAVVAAGREGGGASDLIAGDLPVIEVGAPPDGCVHPSGIIRVVLDRVEVTAFATTLAPAACASAFGLRAADWVVHRHHDEATGVTVVHVEAAAGLRRAVLDLMEDLLASCVAEELASSR